jgi:hypothetical protein
MRPLPLPLILKAWWPLAASWLFMALEQPIVGAAIARLADPTVHLAALGGVVFPVSLIIESPIIMLLAASTALSKNQQAYRLIRHFMMTAGLLLTVLHALVAFTPLYDLVVVTLLNPPAEVVEPSRWGLMVMLPFTWSIAYRRFHQGLLIRHGRSLSVSIGTALRLLGILLGIAVGLLLNAPGIVVGTMGIATGVLTEAAFIAWRVRPVVREQLPAETSAPLSWQAFYRFYTPLALTSLLLLAALPIGSAALARMPNALASLAAWPVLNALLFLLRGLGIAYNEVVVAMLDQKGARQSLQRFSHLLSLTMTGLLLVTALSPLSRFFFGNVMGLEPNLVTLASNGLLFALAWPALTVYQNYYQGMIVYGGQTRHITQSVVISLVTTAVLLFIGTQVGTLPGLYVATIAFVTGTAAQVAWLAWCSVPVARQLSMRDEKPGMTDPAAVLAGKA